MLRIAALLRTCTHGLGNGRVSVQTLRDAVALVRYFIELRLASACERNLRAEVGLQMGLRAALVRLASETTSNRPLLTRRQIFLRVRHVRPFATVAKLEPHLPALVDARLLKVAKPAPTAVAGASRPPATTSDHCCAQNAQNAHNDDDQQQLVARSDAFCAFCAFCVEEGVVNADQLLTTDEVAELLGVSRWTVVAWRTPKEGPEHVRVGPRLVRYRRSDVHAFLDAADIEVRRRKAPDRPPPSLARARTKPMLAPKKRLQPTFARRWSRG